MNPNPKRLGDLTEEEFKTLVREAVREALRDLARESLSAVPSVAPAPRPPAPAQPADMSATLATQLTPAKLENGQEPTRQIDPNALPPAVRPIPKPAIPLSKDEVALYIDFNEQPRIVQLAQQLILGRYTDASQSPPRVDLSPYGAADKGVSRLHAAVRRIDGGLIVEDLNSSNGTWQNGIRLEPTVRYPLKSGDRLTLGQLVVTFYYEEPPNLPAPTSAPEKKPETGSLGQAKPPDAGPAQPGKSGQSGTP